MKYQSDYFLRRSISTLRADLPPERQKAFDEWAATGRPLQEQLDLLTEDAMKRYCEPEFLKEKVVVKDTMHLLRGV